MTEKHWRIEVYIEGESVLLCLESDITVRKEFSDDDRRIIRTASERLVAFIGTGEESLDADGLGDSQ